MDEQRAWERRDDETTQAYKAFTAYYLLPADERSIDAAWRKGAKEGQNRGGKRAPSGWERWSSKYEWVRRAAAYDDHLARLEVAQHEAMWQERRRALRERDWAQADAIRALVDSALPHANQFIRQRTQRLPGQPTVVDGDGNIVEAGTPAREITVMAFDLAALARVTKDASFLQRLATDEPTDNIGLSGAALHAAIERGLEALADKRTKANAAGDSPPTPGAGGNKAG